MNGTKHIKHCMFCHRGGATFKILVFNMNQKLNKY